MGKRIHLATWMKANLLQRLDVGPRIYVASDSTTAQFIAHSLRDMPRPPPVTQVYHNQANYLNWLESPRYISLYNEQYGDCIRRKVDAELARTPFRRHNKIITKDEFHAESLWKPHYDRKPKGQFLSDEPAPRDSHVNQEPIENLIIAEKAQYVETCILGMRHRLGKYSTILIVSPVLGIMERLVQNVFPDPQTRPKFLLGEFTHLLTRPDTTREHGQSILHQLLQTRAGHLFLTRNPISKGGITQTEILEEEVATSKQGDYLMETLLRVPKLSTFELSPLELHMRQLDAIAVRSVIRPLTAMMDSANGALLYNFHLTRVMRLIIAETSLILRSLPEVRGHPNAETRYGPDRLELVIAGILNQTQQEHNGTVIDVRRGKRTDVEFVNGYLIDRAQEMGLKAFMNFMMQELVRGKKNMVQREHDQPIVADADENSEVFIEER